MISFRSTSDIQPALRKALGRPGFSCSPHEEPAFFYDIRDQEAYTRYREAQNLTSTQVTSTFLSRHCSKNKRHYSLPLPPAYISPKPARSNFGFYRDINLQSSVGETAPKHTKYSRVKPFRDIAVCRWLPDYRVCSLSHYPVLSVCFQIA